MKGKQTMKNLLIATALVATTTSAYANEAARATVRDVYRNDTVSVPREIQDCHMIDVPIYETVRRQRDAGAGALGGMIIGGLLGKGLTGKDDGAAVGAVMGGIIGANEASKGRDEQVIIGYRQEQRCVKDVVYEKQNVRVYSHSEAVFVYEGKRYKLEFQK
jgi:uncharacterized protein YcfJ